ncbi:hypothetical protein BDN72DRAFT_787740 [Pluteus cervinus]|uniref:Uncharacterized protein n=1 Tax=Pluteus cervinus TaxID=181527 RepID=A0ACD3BAN3_9AGAR|nr:hypothetical protein BDN72DRAFT_787740 [Pluteus cervinus]
MAPKSSTKGSSKPHKEKKPQAESTKPSTKPPAAAKPAPTGSKRKATSDDVAGDSDPPKKAKPDVDTAPLKKQKKSTIVQEQETEPSPKRRKVEEGTAEVKKATGTKSKSKDKGPLPKSISRTEAKSASAPQKERGKHAKSKPEPVVSKKKTQRAASPEDVASGPSDSDASGSENEDGAEEDEGDDEDLHGFSSENDEDSSDEEDFANKPSAFELDKLPTIAKDDETVKRKLERAKRQNTGDRGVICISRLPHGFYEDQLKGYFSQFGDVTRLRVSRNKKTGKSKHYGFIEFDSSAVAQIVAETMDNYLIMGHILRCKVVPKDKIHPQLWMGANRKYRRVPADRIVRLEHNKARTQEEQGRANERLLKRQEARKRKLKEAGIKYDFDAVSYKKVVTSST